ncbi:MAG: hypothetical protein GWN00_01640, partial [Aliifodinibius sp.]|nr:hypothetical protein [candidate division Zixibacteria bacterium]NIT54980.1 hypothetical protein [Fodinibius sp.]NIW44142.1 hypothetical protein [Gammaproteobacteria bacterium]NIS44562.1 hypothetical protein [candidate division Zixibacteria bacterium]NIU12607.1 hypothetical protein [candidate division Zixibacteria bacterium]
MIAIATAPDQSTRLDTLTVNISPVNDPPQTSIYNLYVSPFSNNLYNLKLYASDVDHAAIELDWDFWGFNQFNIEWYDQQQNIIEIIPGANATSETGVFKVIDPLQAADTAQVTIIYSENNTAPHLLLPNSMILGEDSSITLNLVNRVIDSTNTANELNWEITAGENLNTNFDSDQLSLSIQPAADWYGQSFITFAVSDPFGLSDQKQLVVEVERRNDIENLTIGDVSDNEATFNIQTEIPSIIDFSYWYNISQITTVRLTNYSTNHSISLQNLVTDTTYYYHMKITDEDGRTLSLQDSSFRTVTTDATDSKQPIVYPNPIKPSEGYSEMIFTNLPEESQKIS